MSSGQFGNRRAGAADDPFADLVDQPGLLGDRYEFARRHQSALGMLPAQQRLEAGDAVAAKVEERLEHQKQLVPAMAPSRSDCSALRSRDDLVVAGLEEADRAGARFLGAIERGIGILHDVKWRVAVARRQHDADAGRADDLAALDLERFVEGRDEALGDLERILRPCQIGHHQRELVAADACDMLGRAGAALQAACDLDQKFVAGRMAELVVDLLEAIEVEQKHREFLAGQSETLQGSIERFVEGDPIGQMGQRILPHRALGLDLPHHAPCERERIDEHRAQQHAPVDHHQDSHQHIGGIAVPAEADRDANEDRCRKSDRRNRDRGEGQRAAGQHARAKAGDDELAAGGCMGEEGDRDDAPGGAENESVAHQPMHCPARDELRFGDAA